MATSADTGRAGEHLVAHVLILRGCQVSIVNNDGVDLWAVTPTGERVHIEVKSAYPRTVRSNSGDSIRYAFNLRKVRADYVALVALDLGLFLFRRAPHSATRQVTIRQSCFTMDAMEEALSAHLLLKTPT